MASQLEETLRRDTDRIRIKVTEMAKLAESALAASLRALVEGKRQLAYSIILRDQRIDALEQEIDRLCLEFLVRQQPVARQLRFAYVTIKINQEIERIGDYAESIARQILKLAGTSCSIPLERYREIAGLAIPMFHDAVRAYLSEDAELARRVVHVEEEVDNLRDNLNAELVRLRQENKIPLEALTPQLLTDPQQQIERERRYGQMLAALGDYSGALERFDLALTLARGRKDRRAEAAILCATGESIYWNGDSLASVPILEQAIELSHQTQDLATQAQAEATLSAALSDLSRHQEALLAADRALVCYRSLGDRVGEADVLAAIGAVLCEQGELSKAEAGYAQALSIQREVGYRYAEARTLINWGAVAYMQGKVGDALEHFEAASQIGREIGSERAWNYAETNIAAVISTYIGDLPRGRRAVEEVIALQRSQENKPLLGQALGIQAQFDYLAGELAAAREHLNEALAEMAASAESPWLLAQIHQARAQAHLRLGQYREASEDIEAALAYCETHGFSDFTPGFFTTKAQILRAQNQIGPAGDAIQAGVAALTPGLFQAYLVHFEHYQVLQASGRPAEAGAALAEAVRALTEMLDTLSPKDQQASRNQIPEHRAILAAWAENQAIQTQTTLPRADAPLGRPLSADEQIAVTWTVETPQDRAIRSKGKRRRQQIVRLLHEAQSQNALPAYHHLAEALGVSQRTILRDMAALNQAGIDLPPTRGEQA